MRTTLFFSFFLICSLLSAKINTNLPNKDGMTVKGVVYCGNNPLSGVQVSDGINITRTDKNGWYYLPSDKSTGYVFICNPVGYAPEYINKYPAFYHSVDSTVPEKVEQHDFKLNPTKCSDPAVIMIADLQLCGRYDDVDQYCKYVVPDINKSINKYRKQGKDVFLVTLGDQSYNSHWDLKNIRIPEVAGMIDKLCPDAIYQCMGNHENDESVISDWDASGMYRKEWGPTYYSMNIGKIHYVVLDNIIYNGNEKPSWKCDVTPQIFDWIKQDIESLSKDSPLVICMHAPVFNRTQFPPKNPSFNYDFGKELYDIIKDFKDVRVFSGHTHISNREKLGNLTEYNVAAACGSLWLTGMYTPGLSVCKDGTPAGYQVMLHNGEDFSTHYKCIGFDEDYQFSCFDLNNCHITREKFAPAFADQKKFDAWQKKAAMGYDSTEFNPDGSPIEPNHILIDIFAFAPGWKVEAFENDTPLTVNRVSSFDPLSIISDCCQRFDKTGKNSMTKVAKVSHLFSVTAQNADTPITIKVTDEFGNVYSRVMNRPAEFSLNAYTPNYE